MECIDLRDKEEQYYMDGLYLNQEAYEIVNTDDNEDKVDTVFEICEEEQQLNFLAWI